MQGGLRERRPGICWAGAREGTPAGTGAPTWTATLCCQQKRGCLSNCVCPPSEPGRLHNALKFGAILSRLVCCLVSCAFSPSGHSFSLFGCLQFSLERKTRHCGVHTPVSPPRAEPTAALSGQPRSQPLARPTAQSASLALGPRAGPGFGPSSDGCVFCKMLCLLFQGSLLLKGKGPLF